MSLLIQNSVAKLYAADSEIDSDGGDIFCFTFFLVFTPLIIENFLSCPPMLFGHFQSSRFFFGTCS
jgi:hypothetical protein